MSKNGTKQIYSKSDQFFCGAFAGLFADIISHPLDLIRAKIVMQNRVNSYHYKGTFDAVKIISATEGVGGFYRGIMPVLFGGIPANGLYFFFYEQSKNRFEKFFKKKKSDRFLVSIFSGLVADIAGSFIWVPQDVLKQNVMVYPEKTQMSVVKEIWKREGFKGYFRGYFASIYTFAPYVMLNFAFYEKIKTLLSTSLNIPRNELPKFYYFIGAVTSSYISSFLTTPFCVGRTRIQCESDKIGRNLFKELTSIIKEEGFYSLVEVWKTRSLWFAVGTGLTFLAYESLKNFKISMNQQKLIQI